MSLLRKILGDSVGAGYRTRSADDGPASQSGPGATAILSGAGLTERASILRSTTELSKSGRFGTALAQLDRALAATPNDPELLLSRSSILSAWGRFHEARDAAMQAEALGLRDFRLYVQMGWSCYCIGRMQEAETSMRKAIAVEPKGSEAFVGLGTALHTQGRLLEAIAAFRVALELSPDDAHCLINIGVCELQDDDLVAAEATFRKATALDEGNANAWSNLGVALGQLDRHCEAIEVLRRAEQLDATNLDGVDAYVNLAKSLADMNLSEQALDVLETNLGDRPNPRAQIVYAHELLRMERLREGWEAYEFRWLNEPLQSKRLVSSRPLWNGQDLRGKKILLRPEQGLGDTIQFARYAARVKALGATVLLVALPGLESLLSECPGIDRILSPGAPWPEFDYFINLMSLARIFGTDLESIPAGRPYLRADHARAERWKSRLAVEGLGTLNVGLVWRGDPNHERDRYRSIPLRDFAPLASVEEVQFFSLQKGARLDEIPTPDLEFLDLAPELADLRDAAALISQLDLLICVDTAVAHLGGALGAEVWLLLPIPSDWRWLKQTEQSPWYPSMRIFRQREQGNWNEVLVRVATALRDRAAAPRKRISQVAQTNENPAPAAPAMLPDAFAPTVTPGGFTKVAETRYGIVQYLPEQQIVAESVAYYGELLQAQLDLLSRMIPHGGTGLEVGAGVGAHSLFFANALGDSGHLYVFEPQQKIQRVLQQNLRANRVANVTVLRSTPGAGLGPVDELQIPKLDLLKINGDIDAITVIDGAKETLWQLRPVVFAAAGDDRAARELASRIKDCGYRCWRNETTLFNPENFARRTTNVFTDGTALAILGLPEEREISMALDGCVEL